MTNPTQLVTNYWASKLPSQLHHIIDTANSDLYHGPIYTNGRGEWLSCFDEGARQFDFIRACQIISDKLDPISDTYYQDWSECVSESEPDYDDDPEGWYIIERRDIISEIVGCELAHHID